MADFALLLEAPDNSWAEHVRHLMQRALGSHGSVSLGTAGDRPPDAPAPPGFVVTGVAVCDEPADEMLVLLTEALVDYEVETRQLESGVEQLVVRPSLD